MTGVRSVFDQEELDFIESSIGLVLSDTKDYTDDELLEIYDLITEELPCEFDEEGYPLKTGWLFEHIIDKFLEHFDD